MDTARGSDRIERWLGLYQKTMKSHTQTGYGFFAFPHARKEGKMTKIKVTFRVNLLGK